MAPPRKTGQVRPAVEDDPEKANATMARAPNPLAEDPEAANATNARAPNPLARGSGSRGAVDPEQANATMVKETGNPFAEDEANKTQAKVPKPLTRAKVPKARPAQEDEDYHTGANYQAATDDPMAGTLDLQGDGLDSLEPDIGPRTKALPALEVDDEGGGDDDDEGADDANATHAGPPIKIEIVEGPDKGKTKKFKGVRMVIGRTPGVDLLLSDQSVSRRHVELVQSDKGVLMRDLGSGNGTKVNGSKVGEKMLEHGDEISIGKTKIRFVDEVAAFTKMREEAEKKETESKKKPTKSKEVPAQAAAEEGEGEAEGGEDAPAPDAGGENDPSATLNKEEYDERGQPTTGKPSRPRPSRDRARPVRGGRGGDDAPASLVDRFKALSGPLRLGLVAGVAFIFLLLIVSIATRKPPPPPIDPNLAVAEQMMADARQAVRDGDFEKAVKLVEMAEAKIPGSDKTKLGAQAKEQLGIQKQLDEAKGHVDAKRFDDARKVLAAIPTANLLPRFDAAKHDLETKLAEAEVNFKKAKAEEFLASGEVEAAKQLLGELPVDKQADLAAKIGEFERQLEEQKKQEEHEGRARSANAAAAAKARREEEIALAFSVVERKFAGADWPRATSECARVIDDNSGDREILARAKSLATQIPNFGRNYDEGIKKFKQGQIAQSARPLRLAWQLYGQMGLRNNGLGQDLSDKLAQAALVAGREAALREDLVSAAQFFRDAAKLDPNEPKARAGLEDVVSRAEDLFQAAYTQRSNDPKEALRKFKIVVEVTPAGSATHEKAKNQIAAMAP